MNDISPTLSPAAAFAWLEALPRSDVLEDIVPLRQCLRTLATSTVAPDQRLRALTLAEQRLTPISREISALLCGARQPVPTALRTLALAGRDLHALLADGCEFLATRSLDSASNSLLGARLLRQLEAQLLLSCVTTAPLPAHFWEHATAAHASLGEANAALRIDAERAFGVMLAISCVQPESFTPWELLLIADVIRRHADRIHIERTLPESGDGWFWLAENGQFPPMPLLRQHYAIRDGGFFFHFEAMTQAVQEDISRTEHLNGPQYQQVFKRAFAAWCEMPHRRLPRRRQSYRVDVCTRLGELWQAIQTNPTQVGGRSEWMVQNESASGLAIVHIAGDVSGLVTGGVVGLRTMDGAGWKICLVRWLRNPDPSNLEIGIELLAPEVSAIRIVPTSGADNSPLPALLFTYVDGDQQTPALLVTRHDLEGRPFTLLIEKGDQLKLASCRFGKALCRTNALEIIAYARDDQLH